MGHGPSQSQRDPLIGVSRYPGLRIGHRNEVFSVIHDVLWDEHFAEQFGFTADKATGEPLSNVVGTQIAHILSLVRQLKEFTVHFRAPRRPRSPLGQPNSPFRGRSQISEHHSDFAEFIVYGVEVENSGCCAIPDSILWFVPIHLIGSEKKLSREKYLKEAPQQLLCRCGTYTVHGSTFASQAESVRYLIEQGHRLLHNVVHSACFQCNVKGATPTSSVSSTGCSDSPDERFLVPVSTTRHSVRRDRHDASPSSSSDSTLSVSSSTMRLHAVVVASDATFAERMKTVLGQCGLSCSVCTHGLQAVNCATNDSAGLVVIDVVLSGMSGSEVISSIAKNKRKVPILAVAGSPMFSELALACGATAFLLKNSSNVETKKVIYSLMTKATASSLR